MTIFGQSKWDSFNVVGEMRPIEYITVRNLPFLMRSTLDYDNDIEKFTSCPFLLNSKKINQFSALD